MSRVYEKLQEVGLRYFAQTTLQRIVPTDWLRAGSLVVLLLEPEKGRAPSDTSDRVSRFASRGDLELLGAFGHSRETLESRLGRGDRVFVLQRGAQLLGYAWFRSGVYEEEGLGIRFRIQDDEAWLYDAMIARSERGRGLYPGLLAAAGAALASTGVARIWIAVEALNRNSVEAHVRGGARPVATLRLFRVFGRSWLSGARQDGVSRTAPGSWPEIASRALRAAESGVDRA